MRSRLAQFRHAVKVAGMTVCVSFASACTEERSRATEGSTRRSSDHQDYRALLDRVRARQSPQKLQDELQFAIRRFQHDFARLPTNLSELVSRRYLPALKEPPQGFAYHYDPVHGNVALIPVSPSGLIQLADEVEETVSRISLDRPLDLPAPE